VLSQELRLSCLVGKWRKKKKTNKRVHPPTSSPFSLFIIHSVLQVRKSGAAVSKKDLREFLGPALEPLRVDEKSREVIPRLRAVEAVPF
jgi:hypothetical protein